MDVPPTVSLVALKKTLDEGEPQERWGYEEALLVSKNRARVGTSPMKTSSRGGDGSSASGFRIRSFLPQMIRIPLGAQELVPVPGRHEVHMLSLWNV